MDENEDAVLTKTVKIFKKKEKHGTEIKGAAELISLTVGDLSPVSQVHLIHCYYERRRGDN